MQRHLHSILICALVLSLAFSPSAFASKLPELTPQNTTAKINEIMKAHATYKKLNPTLVKRALQNYIEELDPTKTYFIEPDIHRWLDPSDDLVNKTLKDFNNSKFSTFEEIYAAMVSAIARRHELEKKIDLAKLPKKVNADEFKD